MNLFAGLEKFGIKADNTTDLFEDEKKPAASADGGKTEAAPTEDSFLLDKAIRCTVCDKVFKTKMIKNGRPHIYLALSSLTFGASLCAASCFTSSTPLVSNASALYWIGYN